MSSIIRVGFYGFWPEFSPDANIFINSLLYLGFRAEGVAFCADANDKLLILYQSIFGESLLIPDLPSVFFLGEAIDPPSNSYALSFVDDKRRLPLNTYFPLWLMYFNWFPGDSYGWHTYTDYRALIQAEQPCPEKKLLNDKLMRCVALIGNLTPRRKEVIRAISSVLPCDCYGSAFGRTLPSGYQAKKKLLDKYAFHYCEENTLKPGYITEKIIHSRLSASIPIYNSYNSTPCSPLNPEAFIDTKDLAEMATILDACKSSSTNIIRLNSAPLFRKTVNPIDIAKSHATVLFSSLVGTRHMRSLFP